MSSRGKRILDMLPKQTALENVGFPAVENLEVTGKLFCYYLLIIKLYLILFLLNMSTEAFCIKVKYKSIYFVIVLKRF